LQQSIVTRQARDRGSLHRHTLPKVKSKTVGILEGRLPGEQIAADVGIDPSRRSLAKEGHWSGDHHIVRRGVEANIWAGSCLLSGRGTWMRRSDVGRERVNLQHQTTPSGVAASFNLQSLRRPSHADTARGCSSRRTRKEGHNVAGVTQTDRNLLHQGSITHCM
jgi:hypothetical protein